MTRRGGSEKEQRFNWLVVWCVLESIFTLIDAVYVVHERNFGVYSTVVMRG